MDSVERAAMIKGTWTNYGWDEAASTAKRKQKIFEQLSWETIYCKIKERKIQLVGEEEQQNNGGDEQ
eukprot:9046155-Ditylum_brightwellii.AAC.1